MCCMVYVALVRPTNILFQKRFYDGGRGHLKSKQARFDGKANLRPENSIMKTQKKSEPRGPLFLIRLKSV